MKVSVWTAWISDGLPMFHDEIAEPPLRDWLMYRPEAKHKHDCENLLVSHGQAIALLAIDNSTDGAVDRLNKVKLGQAAIRVGSQRSE